MAVETTEASSGWWWWRQTSDCKQGSPNSGESKSKSEKEGNRLKYVCNLTGCIVAAKLKKQQWMGLPPDSTPEPIGIHGFKGLPPKRKQMGLPPHQGPNLAVFTVLRIYHLLSLI